MSNNNTPTPVKPPYTPPAPEETAFKEPSVAEMLAQLQLKELLKKSRLEDETLENAAAARRQNAKNEENKRLRLKRQHDACSHLMENGKTFLGGQRDHSGNTHYICQLCGAEFNQITIPPHLKPPLINVGGPNN